MISLEIRSLHIDFDNDILEINGKRFEEPIVVNLPLQEEDHYKQKGFNIFERKPYKECNHILVLFAPAKDNLKISELYGKPNYEPEY